MNIGEHIGSYFLLLRKVFSKPDNLKMFFKEFLREAEKLGFNSLGIVSIISLFIGAVLAIQTAYNIDSGLIPAYTVGLVTRDTLLLEFSSTIMCLLLAGKVGSNIASEIGTMRVTEQIDALDIMGVNSANYLIFPKLLAFVTLIPALVVFSMGLGMIGGYVGGVILAKVVTLDNYLYGLQFAFKPYYVFYSLIKSIIFAFIIVTVTAYYGYTTSGGALDVGKSSTKAVVNSTVIVLLFNVILTQLMLT